MIKKSTHKLLVDDVSDYYFFGIATSEADYKISLGLNRLLNLNLKSEKGIMRSEKGNAIFNRFIFRPELNDINYQLVCNKAEGSILSSSYPTLDYLFLICGEDPDTSEIRDRILSLPEVTAVFILDRQKMSEEYLLLQIS